MEHDPQGQQTPGVEASIVAARSTGESIPAAVVRLRFHNASGHPLRVMGYRIEWTGGRFETEPGDLRLDAGEEVERTARIDVRHGDVAALLRAPEDVEVIITRVEAP